MKGGYSGRGTTRGEKPRELDVALYLEDLEVVGELAFLVPERVCGGHMVDFSGGGNWCRSGEDRMYC